jgi:DSF synthase
MQAVVGLGASPRSFATQQGAETHSLVPGVVAEGEESAAARLFKLDQLEVSWEEPTGTLWTFMRPHGRPCYNLELLEDFHAWQRDIVAAFGKTLRYLVLASHTTGAFNLGGDLNYFLSRIEEKDRAALLAYGVSCIRILYRNIERLGLPIVTIGVAQGDALGGGLESLLSFNVIIAERQARFGFPESHFGLFPGMGAFSLVSRRVNSVFAEEMILSGRIYTAEEMKEMGLVHILAEPGQGLAAARDYIRDNARRHAGLQAFFQATREVNGVTFDELERVVEIWAETCLKLEQRELRIMQRLVSAQDRLYGTQGA